MRDVYALGIDPGFARIGLSLVKLLPQGEQVLDIQLLTTEKSDKKRKVLSADDNTRRTREIVREIVNFIGDREMTLVCCEAMSYPRNSSAAAKMALSWGVIITLAELHDLPILQVSPKELKMAVCGSKTATKEEVQAALNKRYWNLPELSQKHSITQSVLEHPYDATGAVVACLDSDLIRGLRKE